jgi:hypothetical protein
MGRPPAEGPSPISDSLKTVSVSLLVVRVVWCVTVVTGRHRPPSTLPAYQQQWPVGMTPAACWLPRPPLARSLALPTQKTTPPHMSTALDRHRQEAVDLCESPVAMEAAARESTTPQHGVAAPDDGDKTAVAAAATAAAEGGQQGEPAPSTVAKPDLVPTGSSEGAEGKETAQQTPTPAGPAAAATETPAPAATTAQPAPSEGIPGAIVVVFTEDGSLGLELVERPAVGGGTCTFIKTVHPDTQATNHEHLKAGLVVCRVADVDVVGRGVDDVFDAIGANSVRPLTMAFDDPLPSADDAPTKEGAPAADEQDSSADDVGASAASSANRARLIEIYTEHKPRKVQDVDQLLREWVGREEQLVARVERKYCPSDDGAAAAGASVMAAAEPQPEPGALGHSQAKRAFRYDPETLQRHNKVRRQAVAPPIRRARVSGVDW